MIFLQYGFSPVSSVSDFEPDDVVEILPSDGVRIVFGRKFCDMVSKRVVENGECGRNVSIWWPDRRLVGSHQDFSAGEASLESVESGGGWLAAITNCICDVYSKATRPQGTVNWFATSPVLNNNPQWCTCKAGSTTWKYKGGSDIKRKDDDDVQLKCFEAAYTRTSRQVYSIGLSESR